MKKMNRNIKILQLEVKDVINNDFVISKKSKRRYKATLDYSLETIKIHQDINPNFTYVHDGKLYTDDIISLTFTINQANRYEIKNSLGEVVEEVELKKGIKKYVRALSEELGEELTYEFKDGKDNGKGKNTAEMREKLYRDGFYIGKTRYLRFKRSGGSARVGKCLFIKEDYFKAMMEWSMMGLNYPEDAPVDLASLEAYIALTTSSIVDTIEIFPNEILVIDDFESTFEDRVMVTKIGEGDRLITSEEVVTIKNSIWDGESILDESKFVGEYADKGMLLLRQRMFKSCGFKGKVQKFFKDYGITDVSQLKGRTLATRIEDIKLITTPSSIKFLKFGSFEDYINQLDSTFGIVKYDKPTHFFGGELVQTHYQLLNTLKFSMSETEELLKDSLDYLRFLKQDLAVLRYHLKMNSDDERIDNFVGANDFVFTMLKMNDKIKNTSMFSRFVRDLFDGYVKNIRSGHILIKGNYSTIFGNGMEMLLSSIGEFDGKSILGVDEVITTRFEENTELLAVRSPHITMGNIWLPKNVRNDLYSKYFDLTPQILCINSIGNNILERLNGCDFDSDTVMITDNKQLVDKAKENYHRFLVPTSKVESIKAKRLNNAWHRYDLDKKTSVNEIGKIINKSQQLNSILWEMDSRGEDCSEVYRDICKLAVMSCIEIDCGLCV